MQRSTICILSKLCFLTCSGRMINAYLSPYHVSVSITDVVFACEISRIHSYILFYKEFKIGHCCTAGFNFRMLIADRLWVIELFVNRLETVAPATYLVLILNLNAVKNHFIRRIYSEWILCDLPMSKDIIVYLPGTLHWHLLIIPTVRLYLHV